MRQRSRNGAVPPASHDDGLSMRAHQRDCMPAFELSLPRKSVHRRRHGRGNSGAREGQSACKSGRCGAEKEGTRTTNMFVTKNATQIIQEERKARIAAQ